MFKKAIASLICLSFILSLACGLRKKAGENRAAAFSAVDAQKILRRG